MKTLLDRCLPLNLPWMERDAYGRPVHPRRDQNAPMKSILISTCGFTTVENNYEALIRQFDLAFGDSLKILCPQGELFAHPELRRQTLAYLAQVTQAGQEYARTKTLSDSTLRRLSEPAAAGRNVYQSGECQLEYPESKGTERSAEDKSPPG